ncbi:MAG: DUF5667 domain-containing protein [bacterium]
MSKKLEQLLTLAKNTPELGKLSAVVKESVRANLMKQISETSAPAVAPTIFDVIRAPFHGIEIRSVLQPVAALGVLAFASVGWIGSVFASMNSIPGDTLYGLKLAAERTQLSFASSDETRVRLHIEFANRRADEVSRLMESRSSSNDARVKEAMGNLKTEVQTVSEHLTNLEGGDEETAVALAKLVDRKVGNLEQAIDANLEGATDSVKQEATEVRDAVRIASAQALTVLVKDDATKTNSTESLGKKVDDRVKEIKIGLTNVEKDYSEVRAAFEKRVSRLSILSESDRKDVAALKEIESDLASADESIGSALDAAKKKDYGVALEEAKLAEDVRAGVVAKIAEIKSRAPKAEVPVTSPAPVAVLVEEVK